MRGRQVRVEVFRVVAVMGASALDLSAVEGRRIGERHAEPYISPIAPQSPEILDASTPTAPATHHCTLHVGPACHRRRYPTCPSRNTPSLDRRRARHLRTGDHPPNTAGREADLACTCSEG